MIAIEVAGRGIDLGADASIPLELRSSYSLTGGDMLQSSYSFPFQLPSTRANRLTLGSPHLPGRLNVQRDFNCRVLLDGVPWFSGRLIVDDADTNRIEAHLVIDVTAGLRDVKLEDLDFGGNQIYGDTEAEVLGHMLDTAVNPEQHDHLFTPIHNQYFHSELPNGAGPEYWQNFYDRAAGQFVIQNDPLMGISPQPYLTSLFKAAQATSGVTVLSPILSGALSKLFMYCNGTISTSTGLLGEWDMAKLMPPGRKFSDVLRLMADMFCATVDIDSFGSSISVVPLRDKLAGSAVTDWSDKLISPLKISSSSATLTKFSFKNANDWRRGVSDISFDYDIDDVSLLDDTYPSGLYRVLSNNTIYEHRRYRLPGASFDSWDRDFVGWTMPKINTGDGAALEVEGGAMLTAESTGLFQNVPQIEVKKWPEVPPLNFGLYRGMYMNAPLASSTPYIRTNEPLPPGSPSIFWDGDQGLYNRYYRPVLDRFQGAKKYTAQLLLTTRDLLSPQRNGAILFHGQRCLITNLSLDLRNSREHLCDAELIAV